MYSLSLLDLIALKQWLTGLLAYWLGCHWVTLGCEGVFITIDLTGKSIEMVYGENKVYVYFLY